MPCGRRRCSGTPSHPGCICVGNHGIWVLNVAQNPWYPILREGYEKCLWTLAHLGTFPTTTWSTLCICPHSFWQGSTTSWWNLWMNSKWVHLKIVSSYFHTSACSRFPTSPWSVGLLWEERKYYFPNWKNHEQKNTLLENLCWRHDIGLILNGNSLNWKIVVQHVNNKEL